MTTDSPSNLSIILRLFSLLSFKRRIQFFALGLFTLVSALAEMAILVSVAPLLSLLTTPDLIYEYPFIHGIFNTLGWGDTGNTLLYSAIGFGILAILAAILRILIAWAGFKFTYTVGKDLGTEVYRRTLCQTYNFHVSRNSSEIIAGLNKVQHVVYIISQIIQCIIAATLCTAIFIMLLKINALAATSIIGCFACLYFGVSLFTRKRLQTNSRVIAGNEARRIQALQEGLGGIRDILVDNKQAFYLQNFSQYDSDYRDAQAANSTLSATPRHVIEGFGITIMFAVAYFLSRGEGGFTAAIPVLGTIAIGAQRLLPLAQQLYMGWAVVTGGGKLMADVLELMEMPIAPLPVNATKLAPLKHHFQIQNISFQYRHTPVLKDISFDVPSGSKVGIIGKTGSGKSTLMDIILGLLEPSTGTILVDGVALTSANIHSWQANIAHVPQTVYLSDASITDNIALGIPHSEIDFNRVEKAAKEAHLDTFIKTLAYKYNTHVGERGIQLSGGQRQRIGIARALYKQATVIILDEATSALDNNTEELVMQSIRGLASNITVFIVAHRLTTLRDCDLIVELSDGNISRLGSYNDLIKNPTPAFK